MRGEICDRVAFGDLSQAEEPRWRNDIPVDAGVRAVVEPADQATPSPQMAPRRLD